MLKASQPEKKQPVTPKHPNGALHKKEARKNYSKNISKNGAGPRQTDAGKEVKHKTVPNNVVPKDSRVTSKVPAVLETGQSTAPKRKGNSGKSNGEQAAKKIKSVVEKTKPTE